MEANASLMTDTVYIYKQKKNNVLLNTSYLQQLHLFVVSDEQLLAARH